MKKLEQNHGDYILRVHEIFWAKLYISNSCAKQWQQWTHCEDFEIWEIDWKKKSHVLLLTVKKFVKLFLTILMIHQFISLSL